MIAHCPARLHPARLPHLALLLVGCAGPPGITETGNPEADVRVTLVEKDRAARAARPVVDSAWVFVDELKLEVAEGCDGPESRELEVPSGVAADLAAEPIALAAVLEQTRYCRLRVRFDRADEGDGPPGFEDLALWMTGTTSQGTPWSLQTRDRLEVDLRAGTAPFAIDEASARLLLAFDLEGWLTGVGIEGLAPVGGVIVVDDDVNDEVLERFLERAEDALSLHRDEDGDDAYDPGDELLAGGGG